MKIADMLPNENDPVISIPCAVTKSRAIVREDTVSAMCVYPGCFSAMSMRTFKSPVEVAGPKRFRTTPLGCRMITG